MPGPSFRDRFFTPPVAKAMTSPSGIVLAGAGLAVGVATGLPVVVAAVIGAAAWAGRVLVAVPKGRPAEGVDPYALSDPWRSYVLAAQAAQGRFQRTVAAVPAGPLHDRLGDVVTRFDDAVGEAWRIARRGHDIDGALRNLDVPGTAQELAQARALPATPTNEATVASLQAQLASSQRMIDVSQDAQSRLRLLDARMDELVARVAELSVSAGDDLGGLDSDVDSLVVEMESLRQALDETGRPRSSAPPAAPAAGSGDGPGSAETGRPSGSA